MNFEFITRGFHELEAAFEDTKVKVDPVLGKALSAAAEPVKAEARRRAGPYSARTATGFRIRRKGTIVRVEQGQRKTTGFHASYGEIQMKHMLYPALMDNQEAVIGLSRVAMDELAARVNEAP